MKDDLVNRSPGDPLAPGLRSDHSRSVLPNELLIKATCERVWQHIVEAAKWPQWYPNSKDVRIIGDGETVLKNGTTFRWTTFGIRLSRINEFVPYKGIGWYGYAPGTVPSFYQTWYLTPEATTAMSSLMKSARA